MLKQNVTGTILQKCTNYNIFFLIYESIVGPIKSVTVFWIFGTAQHSITAVLFDIECNHKNKVENKCMNFNVYTLR